MTEISGYRFQYDDILMSSEMRYVPTSTWDLVILAVHQHVDLNLSGDRLKP